MNVFEVLVIKNPTPNELSDGAQPEVVFNETVTAVSRDHVLLLVGKALEDKLLEELGHRLVVHIKGF